MLRHLARVRCATHRLCTAVWLPDLDFFHLLVSLQSASSHSNNIIISLFHGLHAQNSLFKAVTHNLSAFHAVGVVLKVLGRPKQRKFLLQLSHCRCRRSELDTVGDTLPTRTN